MATEVDCLDGLYAVKCLDVGNNCDNDGASNSIVSAAVLESAKDVSQDHVSHADNTSKMAMGMVSGKSRKLPRLRATAAAF